MEINRYSERDFDKVDAVVLPIFEDKIPSGTEKFSKSSGVIKIAKKSGFLGKNSEKFEFYDSVVGKKIVLIGLGKFKERDLESLRRAYSSSFNLVKSTKDGVALFIIPGYAPDDETKEIVFSIVLTAYDFDKYRSEKSKTKLKRVFISTSSKESIIEEARTVADAVNFTRDVANLPPSVGTPSQFEKIAKKIPRVTVKVFEREDFVKLGMGGLEGVSRAAKEAGKLIILDYGPKEMKPTLIVGKGITFDSGGISIKPSDGMDQMKFDKCGASAVLGTLKLVSDLKLKKHVIGMMPLTENLPGGSAYKPGDILTHYNGVTSEILSTDAEGRLVLADALSYGVKNFKPSEVIDLATLTGACVVALGNHYAGMMGNDEKLKQQVETASKRSWERVWELPLDSDFQEQIKSKVADIKNIGGRGGGAETAGAFLSRFVGDVPWVHLDIAGTAWTQNNTGNKPYLPPGATGYGVRLLYEFLRGK